MKLIVLVIMLSFSFIECQESRDIYLELNLKDISYSKNIFKRTDKNDTIDRYTGYGFLIKYAGHPDGSLSFSGHDNREVGEILKPVRTISKSNKKKLKFTNLNDLVAMLKEHDLMFNEEYKLYFVEPNEEGDYKVYHVKFRNTFWEH
jgi:hypothetical protein